MIDWLIDLQISPTQYRVNWNKWCRPTIRRPSCQYRIVVCKGVTSMIWNWRISCFILFLDFFHGPIDRLFFLFVFRFLKRAFFSYLFVARNLLRRSRWYIAWWFPRNSKASSHYNFDWHTCAIQNSEFQTTKNKKKRTKNYLGNYQHHDTK